MIEHDEAAAQFVSAGGPVPALLQYRLRANRLVLTHTEVPPETAGEGLGGQLVTAAVDYAIERGLTVVPLCPFARSWLRRHPDVANRVEIDWPNDAAPAHLDGE